MKDNRGQHPEFASNFIQAIEAESKKLAQELHDDLNQEFVVLVLEMSMLEREVSRPHAERLSSIRRRLERMIQSTRSFARRLHPSIVEDLGLVAALRSQCDALSLPPMAVSFTAEDVPADISSKISLCLYRVAQEALHNAIKHSGGNSVQVRLSTGREDVVLTVQDLGKGFDPARLGRSSGLGLTTMSERVRFAGGELFIRSAPERGTLIRARIPLSGNGG